MFKGSAGLVDYCASKFGAYGFNESLRNELIRLGKNGIKTTVVCPTGVNTGLFQGFNLKYINIYGIIIFYRLRLMNCFRLRLTPMMTTEYVTDRTIEAILTDQVQLLLPRDMYVTTALGKYEKR